MSVPGIVQDALDGEQVAARVDLDGEDILFVTPSRTIIFRSQGILSDEAIEEYTHTAERVEVSSGRRKARIFLQDDLEGERSFTVPPSRLDDALHPVLAGVLNNAGVTEPGETVKRTFRFSELTVIVTSRRLVKHIGSAVWDGDYEEYLYEGATGLDYEEGSVATQVVLEVDGRRERIKAPNDRAPELRAELEEALLAYYDVGSVAEFEAKVDAGKEPEEPEGQEAADDEGSVAFSGDISPLEAVQDSTDTAEDSDPLAGGAGEAASGGAAAAGTAEEEADGGVDTIETGTTSAQSGAVETAEGAAVTNEELAERLDDLTAAVRRQNELLETHAGTIEQLIEELKRLD